MELGQTGDDWPPCRPGVDHAPRSFGRVEGLDEIASDSFFAAMHRRVDVPFEVPPVDQQAFDESD